MDFLLKLGVQVYLDPISTPGETGIELDWKSPETRSEFESVRPYGGARQPRDEIMKTSGLIPSQSALRSVSLYAVSSSTADGIGSRFIWVG
jgi:hypothetical protein